MIPGALSGRSLPLLLFPLGAVPDRQHGAQSAEEPGDPAYWTTYDHFMSERDRRIRRRRAAQAAAQAWLVDAWRRLAILAAGCSGRPQTLIQRGL